MPNQSHLNNYIGKKFHVGRFTVVVEDIIAEGGFGIVFKVKSQNDQYFALKRICVNNNQDLKVCKREITILSSLTHKNIISLIDSVITEQQNGVQEVLMLLAYCPNTVVQLMKSKQQMQQHLPEHVIISILCDVIEAVARLHYCTVPVIHRDLKVENILIDDRNNYVLCDFGSATSRQIVPSEFGIMKTEEEISKYTTLAYRSPEMVQLSSQAINCKSDIWALGCLLYYLCYFALPFGDKVLAILSGKFNIPKVDVCYSDKLLKLIQYMLTVDPTQRPSIYQISVLAFSLANKKSPIPNFDREQMLNWDHIPLPFCMQNIRNDACDGKPSVANLTDINNETRKPVSDQLVTPNNVARRSRSTVAPVETSINPRDRPRPNKVRTDSDAAVSHIPSNLSGPALSRSFNISLSSSQTNSKPVVGTTNTSNTITKSMVNPPENSVPAVTDASGVPCDTSVTPPEVFTDNTTSLKQVRIGHRRMVSETSSKDQVESSLKSARSLFELTRKDSTSQDCWCQNSTVPSQNTEKVAVGTVDLKDDEVNDAMFGEEFDRLRHESEKSSDFSNIINV